MFREIISSIQFAITSYHYLLYSTFYISKKILQEAYLPEIAKCQTCDNNGQNLVPPIFVKK